MRQDYLIISFQRFLSADVVKVNGNSPFTTPFAFDVNVVGFLTEGLNSMLQIRNLFLIMSGMVPVSSFTI